jgi:hypothetical protein
VRSVSTVRESLYLQEGTDKRRDDTEQDAHGFQFRKDVLTVARITKFELELAEKLRSILPCRSCAVIL